MVRRSISCLGFLSLLAPLLGACGTAADRYSSLDAPSAADSGSDGGGIGVDEVEIVGGVPDRNRDPAVVAIDIEGTALCTGTLVSPRIVLTARHCVSRTAEEVACPTSSAQVLGDRDPKRLSILVGDDTSTAEVVAHGVELVTPTQPVLCDHDIALIILDTAVTRVKALPIATKGAAKGDRVRAVGYGLRSSTGTSAGTKLLREHVKVLSVTASELTVGEATCSGDSGGPALDEGTGEIVGVVSRGGPACEGPSVHNIYTRVDAFASLVDQAFARAGEMTHPAPDGGTASPAPKGTKQRPPSDVGGPCAKGSDCAAGICVTGTDQQYCSRPCGTGDRCPTGYHCQSVPSSSGTDKVSACVAVP